MRYLYAALLAIALSPGPALAHHGWSGYDSNWPLKVVSGRRASGYEHPHGYVKLEAPGKTWLVVLAPPSRMENRGLPSVRAEDRAPPRRSRAIRAAAMRQEMRAERITIDGKTVELR